VSRRKPIGEIIYVGPRDRVAMVRAARVLWNMRARARELGLQFPRWVSRLAKEVRS
jgi:hypothetical protein